MWMDNDLLSGVLILLLFHEAAFLSWWLMLLPESKGCHTPCYWDAKPRSSALCPCLSADVTEIRGRLMACALKLGALEGHSRER